MVVYTDGVTEAMNEQREEFGERRLESAARTFQGDAACLLAHVVADVETFSGSAPEHDDITLIIARRL